MSPIKDGDLFDPQPTPAAPQKRVEIPDFYSMHARKLLGKSDDWRWISLECLDRTAAVRQTLITGAVLDGVLYKSGPRKGEINWKFRHDEARVVVSDAEHEAFIAGWERETGLCSKCGGDGLALSSSGKDGATYKTCWRCKGTGKAEGRS